MRQNFNPFVQKFVVDLTHDADGLLPRPLAVATVILLLADRGPAGADRHEPVGSGRARRFPRAGERSPGLTASVGATSVRLTRPS